jgi:hypothetical protein
LQAYIQQNNLLVELEERKPDLTNKTIFQGYISINHSNTDKRMSYKTLKIEVVDCKLALDRTKIYSRIETRPQEENFFPRLHFNHWHRYKRILYKTLKLEAVDYNLASNETSL